MKTYVVIVTYNAGELIEKCVSSFQDRSLHPNIIVVDNSSVDNTTIIIESMFPGVLLLKLKKNIGFGRANNIGISLALEKGADFVFLLNQDAFVEKGIIKELEDIAVQNPEFGILSPIHMDSTGKDLDPNWKNYYVSESNCPGFLVDYQAGRMNSLYEVEFVNAAAWVISRKCLELVGGFNPLFFMYGEDDEYCNRLHFRNLKIGIVSKSKIRHLRSSSNSKVSMPTISEKKKNILRHFYLPEKIIMLNPQKKFILAHLKSFFKSIRMAFRELLKCNLVLSGFYLFIAIKIILSFRQFFLNRKHFLTQAYPFLPYQDKFVK